jgi:Arc/MetJ-type ribon-helix-helix transcriptional regulator
MAVELKAETEQLVQQEIESGHFRDIDELIVEGVRALRQQSKALPAIAKPRTPRQNLADFLSASPFAGSEINLERQRDYGRPIDL